MTGWAYAAFAWWLSPGGVLVPVWAVTTGDSGLLTPSGEPIHDPPTVIAWCYWEKVTFPLYFKSSRT